MTSVRIETVNASHFEALASIQNDFLNTKKCCCLIPLGGDVSVKSLTKQYNKHPEYMVCAAIALDSETNAPLGFIQTGYKGMPVDMHTCKPGECYVNSIAVLSQARGKGVGTKLLQWGEDLAREKGSDRMTLAVINGNPAKRLYERYGFAKKDVDCVEGSIGCCFISCFLGRPYGFCHSEWGGDDMEKKLEPVTEVMDRK